jgi:hypothetical protein
MQSTSRLASRAAEGADVLQLAAESGGAGGGCGAPDLDLSFMKDQERWRRRGSVAML